MLDYLQILDNPFQDIPLAGALKNQPQGFTFEELARIRNIGNAGERTSLYEALLETEKIREPLGEKVREFLKTYRELRREVPYTPIHQLIWISLTKQDFSSGSRLLRQGNREKQIFSCSWKRPEIMKAPATGGCLTLSGISKI